MNRFVVKFIVFALVCLFGSQMMAVHGFSVFADPPHAGSAKSRSLETDGSVAKPRKQDPCEVSFSKSKVLPVKVLSGTNVEDVKAFKPSSDPVQDRYVADIGGATLVLKIDRNAGAAKITRSFQEPGSNAHFRQYAPVCFGDGIFSAKDLKGQTVVGGLLLLEDKPGNQSIADDMWVFYKASSGVD